MTANCIIFEVALLSTDVHNVVTERVLFRHSSYRRAEYFYCEAASEFPSVERDFLSGRCFETLMFRAVAYDGSADVCATTCIDETFARICAVGQ